MKKSALFFLTLAICLVSSTRRVSASFGVSPADLTFEALLPGTVVEKEFTLSRTDIDTDQNITVETDAEGISGWVVVEPSQSFIFPKGERTIKMKIIMDIPEDAVARDYEGYIYVKIGATNVKSGVSVVSGVGISVELAFGDEVISKLLVREIKIPDYSQTDDLRAEILVENQGNKEDSPDSVEIKVENIFGDQLFDGKKDNLENIRPGEVRSLFVDWENNLLEGTYTAFVNIYHNGQVIKEDTLSFTVKPMMEEVAVKGYIFWYSIENILIFGGLLVFAMTNILLLLILIKEEFLKK